MAKESETRENESHYHAYCAGCGGRNWANFWGLLLLIIGGWFLAQQLGWVSDDFPFWPLVLIVFGAYILYNNLRK